MDGRTIRRWIGGCLITLLIGLSVVAGAAQDHEKGDPRNDVAPEPFAHYAKKRLRDLRAEVGAIGKVMTTFDHRCHLQKGTKDPGADDCKVAADARTHLGKAIEEERYLVQRLVHDGHAHDQWVTVEAEDFWREVHDVGK